MRDDRLDAFLVKVPAQLLIGDVACRAGRRLRRTAVDGRFDPTLAVLLLLARPRLGRRACSPPVPNL